MWGIAFSLNPKNWRFGWCDALDYDLYGRSIVIGKWFFVGPLALTYDYE